MGSPRQDTGDTRGRRPEALPSGRSGCSFTACGPLPPRPRCRPAWTWSEGWTPTPRSPTARWISQTPGGHASTPTGIATTNAMNRHHQRDEAHDPVQHPSTSFNILQHPSTSFNILQHPSTSFNILQHPMKEIAPHPTSATGRSPCHATPPRVDLERSVSEVAVSPNRIVTP